MLHCINGLFPSHLYGEHASKNQGGFEKIKKELGTKKNGKGAEKKMKKEQGWKNPPEQGTEGENVKGAWSKDPPNKASL